MSSDSTNNGSGRKDDESQQSEAASGITATSFRVRSVDELNSDTSLSQNKRKLPDWIASAPETAPKRISFNAAHMLKSTKENAANSENSENPVESSSVNQDETNETKSTSEDDLKSQHCPIQIREEVDSVEPSNPSSSMNNIEVQEANSEVKNENSSSNSGPLDASNFIEVKMETDPTGASTSHSDVTSSSVVVKKEEDVVKQEATSTTRDSCQYGIKCYRRNPTHRDDYAHPGDADYRLPDYPAPPLGTPGCRYGTRCYRRNPVHFQNYSHPPSTDPVKNRKRYLRQRKKNAATAKTNGTNNSQRDDSLDEDDYDLEDPFIDDNSLSEYEPSDTDSSETE